MLLKTYFQCITTIAACVLFSTTFFAQSYTSYFTGNATDVVTNPTGGMCLMGGATESDQAMQWFLQRADGGDILVLRASGSDGYNDYFYTDLGITVNSVESIVCNDASCANETYIHQKIQQAEAIWFAGGDQWNYVSYWRNTAIDSLVNDAVLNRGIVIGGTSAGMAILGKAYFSAENGTVSSATALANPYNSAVAVDTAAFLKNTFLENVITDTHYDDPDRKGRHVTFMARMMGMGMNAKGIACDEYTAVCVTPDGIGRVYGDYPSNDDNAYFIQVNCALPDPTPETCSNGNPLTWNRNGEALVVYQVKGTTAGTNTFDISDWETGSGGTWNYWSVNNGVLTETTGVQPDCSGLSVDEKGSDFSVFPNPVADVLTIQSSEKVQLVRIYTTQSTLVLSVPFSETIDVSALPAGIYIVECVSDNGSAINRIVKR
ncbi:MAG: cyanophycinase [Candidatus Fluviicola riflensis]|nr:MAG: cyanophycinase [Candidatus Fluviicola riflensis]OGS76246.1 MAG: cyanophycinase [Candidatus Fluviicola riflensis]OGS83210.1 MAG: cyanophycinase [Fluviicola sp. RIFCSPHIGHO2_01_FULL_43_53]OGS83778.1 MAG: cyanophycinase [Fluviicola sp. RIFCSPHIGHO2_12_FULL_43_24]